MGFAAALLGFESQLCHLFLRCVILGKLLILSASQRLDLQSGGFNELKDANAFTERLAHEEHSVNRVILL